MLFDKLKIRDVTFRNRIVVSPMCQYSSEDGFSKIWGHHTSFFKKSPNNWSTWNVGCLPRGDPHRWFLKFILIL